MLAFRHPLQLTKSLFNLSLSYKLRLFLIAYLYDRLVHSWFDRHLACPK